MASKIAKIHILDAPYAIDRAYSYLVPPPLYELVCPGVFVLVPFGKNSAVSLGIAVETGEDDSQQTLKEILQVCSLPLSLDASFLRLCFFLKSTTLCTIGDAVRTIVPSAALSRAQERYAYAENHAVLPETAEEEELLDWIRSRHTVTASEIRSAYGLPGIKLAKILCDKGLLLYHLEVKDSPGPKIVNTYRLAVDRSCAEALCRGEKVGSILLRSDAHRAVLGVFLEDPDRTIAEKDLTASAGCSPAQVRALCDKGLIRQIRVTVSRDPYASLQPGLKTEYRLNESLTLP